MSVQFMPAPGTPYGAQASAIGPGTPNATPTMASPMAGLLSAQGGQSADPGMVKLAQAIMRSRMKPPTVPGGTPIDPNGVNGMQGPVPLPQPGAPAGATQGLPPQ